ncbi:hypothetical protein [Methanothrix sp.]|jgi:hypothetical protein|uniref:hypothetical protein n=1 Tax=Methanothrix sp. TaxID=90426 RepID=UPI003C72699D
MVVGRTPWDFAIEAIRMPGFGLFLIALLIFVEIIIILIFIVTYAGLINIEFSYGGLGVLIHHLTGHLS